MKRTPEQALKFLIKINNGISEPLRRANKWVLLDPVWQKCWSGAKHHHMYDGGLVVHTAEVMDVALWSINNDIIKTAVIWHDYAKIYDYQWDPGEVGEVVEWRMIDAPYKKLIHHVQGSAIEFAKTSDASEDINNQIIHCILSHHGRKEWGSVIEPQTVEAMALHYADMCSMLFGEGR